MRKYNLGETTKIRITTIKNIDESIKNIREKIKANDKRIKAIDKRIEAVMKTDKTKNLTSSNKINKYDIKRVLGRNYNLVKYIDI